MKPQALKAEPGRAEPPKPRMQDLAQRLEEAANLRTGIHDSDSKVARINEQRIAVMLQVARELRALS
jgi:hypothetical protein